MIDLGRRATEPELLDAGVPLDEVRRSLGDLRRVNRWLGGHRALAGAVEPLLDGASRVSLLDVGCGSADLASHLVRTRSGLWAVGLDLKEQHLRLAEPGVLPVAGDVRRLPFRDRSFDLVTASLFAHHFDEEVLPGVLAELFRVCARALIVNDLRRAVVPYAFGRLVFPLLFESPVSVHDGLVSIRRAFTGDELAQAFARAGIANTAIRRSFPYRLVAVARREPGA